MQTKKIIGIALCASLVSSMAAITATTVSAETVKDFGSFGICGVMNSWGGTTEAPVADIAMTDEDGDGVYEGTFTIDSVTDDMIKELTADSKPTGKKGIQFKVRADGAWDASWGTYEEAHDRTQNSQTNCCIEDVTVGEPLSVTVKLDTTKVDDAAKANTESYVNDPEFDFENEGFDFWPVTYTVNESGSSDTEKKSFTKLGVVGAFASSDWGKAGQDVNMREVKPGVYQGVVKDTGTYEFKVRADGAWDLSWGKYEEKFDRTQNSQTNYEATVAEGQKLIVTLDTTKVDDEAKANSASAVNEDGFDFEADGIDFWPVTFEVVEDKQVIPFKTLAVVGDFPGNDWGKTGEFAMNDDDKDGIYEAEITEVGTFNFKVRADGAWDYSWGAYETEYDRTQNSQTNLSATVAEGEKLIVRLDTNKVDDEAVANAESHVNEDGFSFDEEGFDYWPVSYEVVSEKTEENTTTEENTKTDDDNGGSKPADPASDTNTTDGGDSESDDPSNPDNNRDAEELPDNYTTQISDYIFFDNSKTKWDQVYAYWWDDKYGRTYDLENNDYGWEIEKDADGNTVFGDDGVTPNHVPTKFPGTKMTQVPGTDIWQIRIPFGAKKIIFNSGKSDEQIAAGEKGYQSQDLEFDPVAMAGKVFSLVITKDTLEEQEETDYKHKRGVEKTKYVAVEVGNWAPYDGEYVPEELNTKDIIPEDQKKSDPSNPDDNNTDNEPTDVDPASNPDTPETIDPQDNPDTPDNTDDGYKPTSNGTNGVPQTGDSSMAAVFVAVAAAALGAVVLASRKKEDEA